MPLFPTSQPGHSDLAHTILPTGGDQATSLASTAASEMSKPTGAQPPLLAGDWPPPQPPAPSQVPCGDNSVVRPGPEGLIYLGSALGPAPAHTPPSPRD